MFPADARAARAPQAGGNARYWEARGYWTGSLRRDAGSSLHLSGRDRGALVKVVYNFSEVSGPECRLCTCFNYCFRGSTVPNDSCGCPNLSVLSQLTAQRFIFDLPFAQGSPHIMVIRAELRQEPPNYLLQQF
jgi:hypothetical protein